MANFIVWVVWCGAAFACIASALGVVSFKNPFFSALALIGNLASLAVLYLLLGGEFVAAGQVLVYGGAVMVMFLFVIAYLGDRTEETPWAGGPSWQAVGTILAAAAILAEVIVALALTTGGRLSHEAHIARAFGSPASIGRLFLTDHLLAFEVTSIVLLVAAVGGVVLGSHTRALEEMHGPDVGWYLVLAALLFVTGALGVLVRRSPLIILLSVEIMLNGANLALISFARRLGHEDGQVFAIAVMAVAASEVVVGLGLIVAMGRRNVELDVDKLRTLRG